ncbi:MAG: metallophosphoesterase [Lachnospiraceae bacterium]|nr:metallophosphoesterase [Lachnospiraceae bacterium]
MRFIHCADLHLDSKMETNLDKLQAKERKAELLATFTGMVEYAAENDISGIIIAGDLFDAKNISATARNTVMAAIRNNPDIIFYILRGNHDVHSLFSGAEDIPENIRLFGNSWTYYRQGTLIISGVELCKENSGSIYNELVTDLNYFNIVVLHGQESEVTVKDKAEVINLRALRGKGIDYLALGHVHEYKFAELPGGGSYCYPGCLEGRGFDECGEHGFVLLDIDERTHRFTHEFIPFAKRRMFTVPVEVNGIVTTPGILSAVRAALGDSRCTAKDLVKLELTGDIDAESELDTETIRAHFKDDFYFVKVKNSTRITFNETDYLYDRSLKGEFVRSVMADDSLSQEDKAAIIGYGLKALKE